MYCRPARLRRDGWDDPAGRGDLLSMPAWQRARAGLLPGPAVPDRGARRQPGGRAGRGVQGVGRDPGEVPGLLATEAARGRFRRGLPVRARSTLTCPAASASATKCSSSECSVPASPCSTKSTPASTSTPCGQWPRRVADLARGSGIGVLAITHYQRLLSELPVDQVHVLAGPCGGYRRPRTGPRARGIGICPLRGRGRRGWPRRGRAIAAAPVIVKAA